jgi:hypothetical protein
MDLKRKFHRLTLRDKNDKLGGERKSRIGCSAFLDNYETLQTLQTIQQFKFNRFEPIVVPHGIYCNNFKRFFYV